MALILIDVDGTLIKGASTESQFICYLLAHGALGLRQLGAFMLFPLRYAACFGRHVFKKNKAHLCGLSPAAVEEKAAVFVDSVLLKRVCINLRHRLSNHRKAGDMLALLTGTPEFIARPLASRLAITHVVGTICEQMQGRFTAGPPLQHPFGKEKVKAANRLCQQLQTPLSDCVAYADSIHDLALMEQVSRAIAVTPDAALQLQANCRGWEIMA
jgi:phosphoserine phosphatase